jgi:hypothetical protein
MKSLKFRSHSVNLILSRQKKSTWRLFDDKDLQAGDVFQLINKDTGEVFGTAAIIKVEEKKLGEITEPDFLGHHRFTDPAQMLAHYRGLYGDQVTMETPLKMVQFELHDNPQKKKPA